mgnify:CR=1 FL=1
MSAPDADERFMQRALELAARGGRATRPNPLVGAVIVRDGIVVAEGFHAIVGGDHAEVDALRRAGDRARGATVYVNLEPCSHFGRTPPCADALVKAGVRRVVAGMIDPNPRVSGRGLRMLEGAGIETRVGVLEDACRALNERFVVHVSERRPFVIAKLAQSLDGRVATRSGESQWISGPEARAEVHALRASVDAILVGTETALRDNPRLTARDAQGQVVASTPRRFVLDRLGRLPDHLQLFSDGAAQTTVLTALPPDAERCARWNAQGVEVWSLPEGDEGGLDLVAACARMGSEDLQGLLVEGGGRLVGGLFDLGLVDRLVAYVHPMVLGGTTAPMAVGGKGVEHLAGAYRSRRTQVEAVGQDWRFTLDFRP